MKTIEFAGSMVEPLRRAAISTDLDDVEVVDDNGEHGSNGAPTKSVASNSTRRRAISIAEAQPSVETVVVKAKRAAQSLWMLLHAQNCVLGQKCPHTGCQEAKLLHLHIKTCRAGTDDRVECPMLYHGCDQSRKLLAHYRRCRTIRAKQVAQVGVTASQRTTGTNAQHHCLVCSMVARQARTMLEGTTSTVMNNKPHATAKAVSVKRTNSVASRKVMTQSYSVPAGHNGVVGMERRMSLITMPPPPPRGSGGFASDSLARLYETAKQLEEPSDEQIFRRPRSASDAETFYNTTKSDLDVAVPYTRERSASLGTAPVTIRHKSSSPPQIDTIVEEGGTGSDSGDGMDSANIPDLSDFELQVHSAR